MNSKLNNDESFKQCLSHLLFLGLLPVIQEKQRRGQEKHAPQDDDEGTEHEGIAQTEEPPQRWRRIALLKVVGDLHHKYTQQQTHRHHHQNHHTDTHREREREREREKRDFIQHNHLQNITSGTDTRRDVDRLTQRAERVLHVSSQRQTKVTWCKTPCFSWKRGRISELKENIAIKGLRKTTAGEWWVWRRLFLPASVTHNSLSSKSRLDNRDGEEAADYVYVSTPGTRASRPCEWVCESLSSHRSPRTKHVDCMLASAEWDALQRERERSADGKMSEVFPQVQ